MTCPVTLKIPEEQLLVFPPKTRIVLCQNEKGMSKLLYPRELHLPNTNLEQNSYQ